MNWDEYEAYLAKYKDRWEANAIRKGILEEGWKEAWIEGWTEGWIEGWIEGWTEGWIEGLKQGEAKKLNEFVLRLAGMDYKLDEILKLTGASLDEVKQILNKRE